MPKIVSLSDRKNFEIRNASASKAEIVLYGIVGDGFYGDGVTAKQFSEELAKLPASVKNIDLRINSPGGDVFQGYTIAQRLKQHPAKVTAYIDGLAASIATVIALAADEVVMGEMSQFMIHKSWTFTAGNSDDLEKTIERLLSVDEQLLQVYTKKTKIDRMQMKAYMDQETWFVAEQALELGFVDRIEGDSVAIAASVMDRATWLSAQHRAGVVTDAALAKEKAKGLKNKIESYLARKKA